MKLIREYIKNHIKKESKERTELDAAFELDQLPTNKLEKRYRLEFGELTSQDLGSGTYIKDEIDVALRFLTSTKKASVKDYDEEMENAITIRREIFKRANYEGTNIARVTPKTISVEPYENNKETILTTIDFTFEVTQ